MRGQILILMLWGLLCLVESEDRATLIFMNPNGEDSGSENVTTLSSNLAIPQNNIFLETSVGSLGWIYVFREKE